MQKRARAVSYILTLTAIALVFVASEFITEKWLYPDDEIVDIITAVIGALLFSRFKRFFDRATDRIFLRGPRDARAEFLANVAHELQTPIAILRGNVEVLQRLDATDAERGSAERVILATLDGMSRLIGTVLDRARSSFAGRQQVRASVPVRGLIEEIVEECAVLAADRGITLSSAHGDPDIAVCGDRDRLKEVLLNLVSNAFKHTPRGGVVVISSTRVRDVAMIVVTDSGCGIPQADLPHIFERFYRIAADRKASVPGAGLGLHICREIVEAHGGAIRAESEPGKGATFTISLPLPPPARRIPVPASSAVSAAASAIINS